MAPYYQRDGITIYCGDNREVLPHVEAVHAVVTDPPYGLGLAEWDKAPDMVDVFNLLNRLDPEFVSVFCQMPFMLDVANAATHHKWHYLEHISWVKRSTTPSARLSRSHESILMYAPGKARKFHVTRGPYEDVRLPGVLVDTVSLEGVKRQFGFLRQAAEGKEVKSSTGYVRASRHMDFTSGDPIDRLGPSNFTNVWSFLPPNNKKRPGADKLLHVSMKPVEICKRLIEMTTLPGDTVLDPFMGSGSTLVAAAELGFDAIGIELSEEYAEIAARRVDHALNERAARLPLEMVGD